MGTGIRGWERGRGERGNGAHFSPSLGAVLGPFWLGLASFSHLSPDLVKSVVTFSIFPFVFFLLGSPLSNACACGAQGYCSSASFPHPPCFSFPHLCLAPPPPSPTSIHIHIQPPSSHILHTPGTITPDAAEEPHGFRPDVKALDQDRPRCDSSCGNLSANTRELGIDVLLTEVKKKTERKGGPFLLLLLTRSHSVFFSSFSRLLFHYFLPAGARFLSASRSIDLLTFFNPPSFSLFYFICFRFVIRSGALQSHPPPDCHSRHRSPFLGFCLVLPRLPAFHRTHRDQDRARAVGRLLPRCIRRVLLCPRVAGPQLSCFIRSTGLVFLRSSSRTNQPEY